MDKDESKKPEQATENTPDSTREYASPACYLSEFEGDFEKKEARSKYQDTRPKHKSPF
jgi:hypothetical protein